MDVFFDDEAKQLMTHNYGQEFTREFNDDLTDGAVLVWQFRSIQ
jgi:hypothetical protein